MASSNGLLSDEAEFNKTADPLIGFDNIAAKTDQTLRSVNRGVISENGKSEKQKPRAAEKQTEHNIVFDQGEHAARNAAERTDGEGKLHGPKRNDQGYEQRKERKQNSKCGNEQGKCHRTLKPFFSAHCIPQGYRSSCGQESPSKN